MKKHKIMKRIFSVLGILLIAISVWWVYFGLNAMDVEDFYGDLQGFYWEGKNGDIIYNRSNSKLGIIEKEKNRIYVLDGKEKVEFYWWLKYEDKVSNFWGFKGELYRSKNKIDIKDLNSKSLKENIQNKELKLIEKIDVKY